MGTAMVQTADSLGSRLSTTSTLSVSSTDSSLLAQPAHVPQNGPSVESDLYGWGTYSTEPESPLATSNASPGVGFISPTSRALNAPAPALATPARDRARQAREGVQPTGVAVATNNALTDRILDIVDMLSTTPGHEEDVRKTCAHRLRLLATLLDGSSSAPITEYDRYVLHQGGSPTEQERPEPQTERKHIAWYGG